MLYQRWVSPTCHNPAALCLQHLTVAPLTTRDEARHWSEIAIICISYLHSTALRESPSAYCHKIWYGKLEWCEDVFSFQHTIRTWRTARRTDGQTPRDGILHVFGLVQILYMKTNTWCTNLQIFERTISLGYKQKWITLTIGNKFTLISTLT